MEEFNKIVIVKDIYAHDTISNSSEIWDVLATLVDGKTLFDFKDIIVLEPWLNNSFNKFLGNELVHMKLYSSKKEVETINSVCILGNLKTGRAINEDIVVQKRVSKGQVNYNNTVSDLMQFFEIDPENNKRAILSVYKKFDQLGSGKTVVIITDTLKAFLEENQEVSHINLELKYCNIADNIIEPISKIIKDYALKGIDIEVTTIYEPLQLKLQLYLNELNKEVSIEDRLNCFKQLVNQTAGMLIRYKKSSRAGNTDDFGRQGGGEVLSCRVALFKGLCNKKGQVCAYFQTFNGNTFYTKLHWATENDGEELMNLDVQTVVVPLNEIGLYDKFFGEKYHFSKPVQANLDGYTPMNIPCGDGKYRHANVTIPERIKHVFDEWNIPYNKEEIDSAIEGTTKILNSLNETKNNQNK